jgi:choline dehydrogenase
MTLSSLCFTALAVASQTCASPWEQPNGRPPYGSSFGLPGLNATYDYVIVGGGTAGLTVASRLAENSSLSIAVIEAGAFSEISNGNNSQVPAYSLKGLGGGGYVNPWIDWGLDTVKQPVRSPNRNLYVQMVTATDHQQQLNGKIIPYAQGKALGGSSIRNQMIYQRGSRGSYDYWASEVDDPSYKWENMRQHFDRTVHVNPSNSSFRAANASVDCQVAASLQTGGPLEVSWPNFAMPFSSWGLKALFASGVPRLGGFFSDGGLHGTAYNVRSCRMLQVVGIH